MAAIGRIKSPSLFFAFKPPHLPRKSTAFGAIALSKSIIIAALGLPIPKFIIVMPSTVALGILRSSPSTDTLFHSANKSTYNWKFVSSIYSPKLSNVFPVYLGSQSLTISSFVFIIKNFLQKYTKKYI